MAKPRFEYKGRERSVESVTRKSKQGSGNFDSYIPSELSFFKPKEGENCVRILPATWDPKGKWGDGWDIGIHLHYDVGPDNVAYLCLDKMKGERCPVCEARRDAADKEEADKLRPSSRQLCWVIDRDNEKAGPQVWSMPATLFKEINLRSIDRKTGAAILIDEPEEGYDLVFSRQGTKLNTDYGGVEVMRDPTPIHDKEETQDRWLDYIADHSLPDILQFYPAEHIEKVLFGKGISKRDEAEEEETTERPSRRTRGGETEEEDPRGARSRRSEPEMDVEEDPKPLRRGRNADAEEEPERGSRGGHEERTVERRRLLREEMDDDIPSERGSRRSNQGEASDEEAEEPETSSRRGAGKAGDVEEVAGRARRSLERLKSRR